MAAIGLLVAGAVLVGCTGSSGVNTQTLDPTSSLTASSSTVASSTELSPSQISESPSPSSAVPSATSGTDSGLSVEESADRAAVESQWVKSWDVYLEIARTPAADREALVATVAVDPNKATMLSSARALNSTRKACRRTARSATGFPGRSPSTAAQWRSSTIARIAAKAGPSRPPPETRSRSASPVITTKEALLRAMTACGAFSRSTT